MRRGFLTPPVIIVLAIITFGVAISIYANSILFNTKKEPTQPQNQTSPSPAAVAKSPQPPLDETANWKTYTNAKMGIAIKYSPDFSLEEAQPITEVLGTNFYTPDHSVYSHSIGGGVLSNGGFINLGVKDTTTDSLETEFQNFIGVAKLESKSNSQLAGMPAIRGTYMAAEGASNQTEVLFTLKGKKRFVFTVWAVEEDRQPLIKTFETMLSTFKFLD